MKKFLLQIIENKIALGKDSTPYTKSKAKKFLAQLRDENREMETMVHNGETYEVWNVLLCAIYDTI